MNVKTKVIFFIAAHSPTEKEVAECESLERPKRHLVYRNAGYISQTDSLEKCDAVAGCVPASYSHLPVATKDGIEKADIKPLLSDPHNVAEQEAIAGLADYSVQAVLAMVTKKEITRDAALLLERKGKNRPVLIEALSKL